MAAAAGGRRPERRAPRASAGGSSTGERAVSSVAAAAAARWPACPGLELRERKTRGSARWNRGSPAEARVRGVYKVIFWLALCTSWSALPNHRRRRAARWVRGGESRRSAWGETFHLVKFLSRHGSEPPSPPPQEGEKEALSCSASREVGMESWPSLGLRTWLGRKRERLADRCTSPRPLPVPAAGAGG